MSRILPLVSVAVLCDRLMHEADGALSIIRIVDTFACERKPDGTGESTVLVRGFIALKSGEALGEHDIRLILRTPSEIVDLKDVSRWKCQFNGFEHGARFAFEFELPVTEVGLFWVDVRCEGERLTSIPLKVVTAERHAKSEEVIADQEPVHA